MRAKVPLSMAVIWIMCTCAMAQSRSTNTGVVSGVVQDQQGARVSNAKVLLRDQNGTYFGGYVDDAGEFRLELPAGAYTLEARVVGGFKPYHIPKFRVNAGDVLTFPILLEPLVIPNSGAIAGVVQDRQGARIAKATIELRDGSGEALDKTADEAGEFWIDVPPGVYSFKVGGILGFIPFKRPMFRVNAGDKLRFPIQLEVASTCDPVDLGIEGQGITQYEEPEPTCGPSERMLAVDEKSRREFVVRYSGRSGTGATREYGGAMLFCDVYSVKADKIVYDSGKKRANAEGRVVVEDGHVTRRVKSAAIQWPECKPEIVE